MLLEADSKRKNSCTLHHKHKPRSSLFLLRGNNSSISDHAKTYVINVCSVACSICASVFLASPYSLCQHDTAAEGPRWSERTEQRHRKEKIMHSSASTRASATTACEPLTCILAVKNVFCSSLLQLSLFRRGDGKQIRLVFAAVAASRRALEVLRKQSLKEEDGIQEDKRHKSLMLSYPFCYSFELNY